MKISIFLIMVCGVICSYVFSHQIIPGVLLLYSLDSIMTTLPPLPGDDMIILLFMDSPFNAAICPQIILFVVIVSSVHNDKTFKFIWRCHDNIVFFFEGGQTFQCSYLSSTKCVSLLLYCQESIMTTLPPLPESVMMILLFLDKPFNAAICLISTMILLVLTLRFTVINPFMNSFANRFGFSRIFSSAKSIPRNCQFTNAVMEIFESIYNYIVLSKLYISKKKKKYS